MNWFSGGRQQRRRAVAGDSPQSLNSRTRRRRRCTVGGLSLAFAATVAAGAVITLASMRAGLVQQEGSRQAYLLDHAARQNRENDGGGGRAIRNRNQQGSVADKGNNKDKKNHRDEGRRQTRCDCATSTVEDDADSGKCCDRKILRAHKMGVVLIRELFPSIPSEIIGPDALRRHRGGGGGGNSGSGDDDYRHVVVTRPIYDSIVSGYLYHKSGRECWLDQHGHPRKVNKTFEWQSDLRLPLLSLSPEEEAVNNGTTLCRYLSETSEEVGLRAYVDFSLSSLYRGLLPHRHLVEEVEGGQSQKEEEEEDEEEDEAVPISSEDDDERQRQSSQKKKKKKKKKTLFVCFADLENPATKLDTYGRVLNWLYPGGVPTDAMAALPASAGDTSSKTVAGGHGTSRDRELRERLASIIGRIDRQHFDGIGARTTAAFGCDDRKDRNKR